MLEIKYNNKSKEYEQLQEMIDALVETLTLVKIFLYLIYFLLFLFSSV